eukprot:COSAG01_NODE_25885_length_730_cov_0.938193_1_plen_64_part_01
MHPNSQFRYRHRNLDYSESGTKDQGLLSCVRLNSIDKKGLSAARPGTLVAVHTGALSAGAKSCH